MSEWEPKNGIFILVNLQGELADRVHAIQQRYDPRMANFALPHFTLIGSSGAGPIAAETPIERQSEGVRGHEANRTLEMQRERRRCTRYGIQNLMQALEWRLGCDRSRA